MFSILVLSCDKYEACWKPFIKLLNKYYPNHPEVYLSTETKDFKDMKVINTNSDIWSVRFKEALKKIPTDYVLILLDDFFIRKPVDEDRIKYCLIQMNDDIAVFNFEKKYRLCFKSNIKGFERQLNNQVYLCSCQPSLWNKRALIELLEKEKNAWEWETTKIDSKYLFYINNSEDIIDIGYNHTLNWGISRGELTEECKEFLKKEGLELEWN